jgi:ABC-2 type transport system permease protein
MTEGVVYDLGYTPHDGPRLGRGAAIRATIVDGLRRVLGLRRKARKKVFPWTLLAIASIPAIVFVGLSFFLGNFTPDAESPFGGHPEYFNLAGTMVMIFAALAGPELLIPDRTEGVLAVYSSRPMRARDYLVARGTALAGVVGFFLLAPQMLMYLGFAALDPDGFFTSVVGHADDLVQITATTAVYVLAYGAPSLLIAVFAKRSAPASGAYLAVMLALTGVAHGIAESGSGEGLGKYAALLAIFEHPHVVRDWIFDRSSTGLVAVDVGWDVWVSFAVIIGIAVLTAAVATVRYRKEM